MRVHLIRRETIEDYATEHASGRSGFEWWLDTLKQADWEIPEDIKATFSSADLLGAGTNRVVFDIGGNKHRLICKYRFGRKNVHLYVCWMGTHAQYDELCKKEQQYSIHIY
jgi:mRNA interferase HigB